MSGGLGLVTNMSAPPPVKKLKTEVRRPDGMQRELYSLLGENTPPVMVVPDHYKSKPDWRQKVTPWTWAPFTNKARDDSLVLHHWVRGQPDSEEFYRFSKFNVKIEIPHWSDEDYQLFKRDDWSIEETQYLFDLCREYDLRWLVIQDRYEFGVPGAHEETEKKEKSVEASAEAGSGDGSGNAIIESSNSRTVEDLKARYYEVCTALLKKNTYLSPNDEELLEQMKFSKENELKRKAHLERLMSRSPNQVAEEEALVLECRRLEALADQMARERAEVISLLDTPAATGSIGQYQSSQGIAALHQQLMAEKSRKPKEPTNGAGQAAAAALRKSHPDEKSGLAAQITQKRLSPKEEAAYGIAYHEKFSSGVYLRSTKLTTLKQNQVAKAQAIFNELGLPMRPVMPTAKVAAKFDVLLQTITVLLDAKRSSDKLETEIKLLKEAKVKPE